jgi:hypothetical protein
MSGTAWLFERWFSYLQIFTSTSVVLTPLSSGWALEELTHHLTRPGPDVDVGIVSFVTKLSGNFEGVFQTCGPFMRHIMLEPRMWKIRSTDFPGFCGQILSGEFFFVYRAKFGAFH